MDWIDKLKAGDEVIVTTRNGDTIDTVLRPTKLYIHTLNYGKFKKKTSYGCDGNLWLLKKLKEPTTEAIAKIRNEQERLLLIDSIKGTNFSRFSFEKLQKIYGLIENNP